MSKLLYVFFPILAFALVGGACSRPTTSVEVPFSAQFGDQPIDCSSESPAHLSDLRFYLFDPRLTAADGRSTRVEVSGRGRWHQDGLVLIDLEDATGECQNGTPDHNATLLGTVPTGDYTGLTFGIGVPFDRNHADPLAAAAPLDDSSMHWHWRSGYKFLRAGLTTANDGYWIHLGSTACRGTVGAISSCDNPNRMTVVLPNFKLGDTIVFDFEALVAGIDLDNGEASDCSSGPAEDACSAAFAVLGLAFNGVGPKGSQRIFRVARP